MSFDDPLPELREILDLCADGKLPEKAGVWAESAYAKAEDILETIESMQSNGVDAPTDAQATALENIYNGACKWLHREP